MRFGAKGPAPKFGDLLVEAMREAGIESDLAGRAKILVIKKLDAERVYEHQIDGLLDGDLQTCDGYCCGDE